MGLTKTITASYTSLAVYDQILTAMTGQKFDDSVGKMVAIPGATAYFSIIGCVESYRHKTSQFWCLMESTPAIDSYLTTDSSQKYRILFTATVTNADPSVSNDVYQNYDNVITDLTITVGTSQQIFTPSGTSASAIYSTYPTIMPNTPTVSAWSRLTGLYNQSADMNAIITLTTRGFSLATYHTSDINVMPGSSSRTSSANFMLNIQRPVNPTDGTPKVAGTAPIFMLSKNVNSTDSGFQFSIIRESDVSTATPLINTGVVSTSMFYKLSTDWAHPNLFDNLTHVIKFPFGFCSSRHIYMEEMDLICLVNAGSFVGNQAMTITMYSETSERTYTSTYGELEYGGLSVVGSTTIPLTEIKSGSRIGILTANGGI